MVTVLGIVDHVHPVFISEFLYIVQAYLHSIYMTYTSQTLIRATQCKFPLQNIQFSCKT